jgi:hypothetical protein
MRPPTIAEPQKATAVDLVASQSVPWVASLVRDAHGQIVRTLTHMKSPDRPADTGTAVVQACRVQVAEKSR